MQKLTGKQKEILDFIETYIEANQESPSLLEIKNHLGVRALSTVHQHIKALESKGFLEREANSTRGINYVMNAGKFIGEFIRIPMVGTIIAGYPIDAVEEIEDYIHMPAAGFSRDVPYFALTVKGDSMIDSYVTEGDIVIAKKTSAVRDGDMVVALNMQGEATLKYFFKDHDRIRLQPANKDYKPMYFRSGELEIQGKVVQVLRKYI